MKQRVLTAKSIALLILTLLLALCLAFGFSTAFADETDTEGSTGTTDTEEGTETDPSDKEETTAPKENGWKVFPSIVSWAFGEYDREINVISAEALYGTDTCRFFLFRSNGVPVEFYPEKDGPNLEKFYFMLETHTGDDGKEIKLVPEEVAEVLSTLGIGQYYLIAYIPETDEYESLGDEIIVDGDFNIRSGYLLTILAPSTGWVTSPSMVSWTYGEFDRTVNTITAVSPYMEEGYYVDFSVYTSPVNSASFEVAGLQNFTVDSPANGFVPLSLRERFNSLDCGTYYLLARVYNPENVAVLSTYVPFYVLKASNYWEASPNVVQWTYNEYDPAKNVISAKPANLPAGSSVIYGVYGEDNKSASGDNTLLNFAAVGTAQEEALASLGAGKYYLKAFVAETNNYKELESTVEFEVFENPNKWTSTPNIVQWTYQKFDVSKNIITAVPALPQTGARIVYGIFNDRMCQNPVEGLEEFASVAEVQDILYSLEANTYWLRTSMRNGSNDYKDLVEFTSFVVAPAENTWETSPYVLSWKYGDYDRNFNKICAEPEHGTAMFSIYKDEACTDPVRFTSTYNGSDILFVLNDDGLVPEYVEKVLKTLGVGTYYLTARVTGTNNYSPINISADDFSCVPFEIQAVQNSWITVPSISDWNETRYDAVTNILKGTPKFGDVKFTVYSGDKLLYTIYSKDGEITAVYKNNGAETDISDLNSLSVGSYRLVAEVEGQDNYSALTAETTFAVLEDSVGITGIIAATVVFAAFDIIAAGVCIALLVIRRKKVEEQFRKMVRKELNRR